MGQRFSLGDFPLCRSYGCRELARSPEEIKLQLLRQDARLTLALSPYGTVMGLSAWVTAPKLSAPQRGWLEGLAERAAEQGLNLAQLRGCWETVRPGELRRVLGGGGEHYGVACTRKVVGGVQHWGVWIYFDH